MREHGDSGRGRRRGGGDTIPLGRLDNPYPARNGTRRWPAGRTRSGTLRVLNYADYITPRPEAFESAMGTTVEITITTPRTSPLQPPQRSLTSTSSLAPDPAVPNTWRRAIRRSQVPPTSARCWLAASPTTTSGRSTRAVRLYRRSASADRRRRGLRQRRLVEARGIPPTRATPRIDDAREPSRQTPGCHGHQTATGEPGQPNPHRALVAATDARFDILAWQQIPEAVPIHKAGRAT